MLQAAELHERIVADERCHFEQRIERAEYEAHLARRQYDSVDPDNRLVARELERRYERALQDVEVARREAESHASQRRAVLCEEEKNRLRDYAEDLPRLWQAPGTRPQDRTRIVRCLIDQVVVTAQGTSPLQVEVPWYGGEISKLEIERGNGGARSQVAPPELIELVRTLAQEFSDTQIARILHRRQIRTPTGLPYTSLRVAGLRRTHAIASGPKLPRRGEDIYTAEEAAQRLDVDRSTVIRWVEAGLLQGAQACPGAPWRIRVREHDANRLNAGDAPSGWLSLKAAAAALGVSHQTVLQKLKSGELDGVRVKVGRRTGWRIHVASTSYEDQKPLFP